MSPDTHTQSQPRGLPRGVRAATIGAVGTVALVAAAVSYAHMRNLAAEAGEQWRAWLLPLAVDGLLVAAAMSMLAAWLVGRRPSPLAWFSLWLGIAASLAANVAAAEPTLTGRLVAAWPPLALALSFELLMQQHHSTAVVRTRPAEKSDEHAGAARSDRAQHGGAESERAPDDAPSKPARRASTTQRATRTQRARSAVGAQQQAWQVFERALAEGRADALTGSALAAEVGAHPGTARKWLAAWRAETTQPAPHLAVVNDTTGGEQ